MLTLFHAAQSRSGRIVWLLEELRAPCAIEHVDIYRSLTGTGRSDPANLHPDGKVPALMHDGALITESAAIALYLTD
ncbi:glutathione S-transferase, partial [Trichormus variabilis FACHB-319]|nr:glutathione S-transferase [Trichormus variabilis FACHB-319]